MLNGATGTFRSTQNTTIPTNNTHIHCGCMKAGRGTGTCTSRSALVVMEYTMNGSDSTVSGL